MLYIGPYEIKSKEDLKDNYVKVVFKNKSEPMIIKQKMYEKMISAAQEDLTQLRDRRMLGPIQDIIKVLLDWDVKTTEVDPIFQRCVTFINQKLDYVTAKAWMSRMKDRLPQGWIPGDVFNERTMADLDSFFENEKSKATSDKARREADKTSS